MTQCPCKGCDDRHFNCHAMCQRFKTWQEVHEEEKRRARDTTNFGWGDAAERTYWRSLRWNRRRKGR